MNYLISSKFKEIFSALKKGLEKSGFQHLPAGVVMTGSPLLMSGVMETAEKEFSLPVRMLKASGITGAGALASNPAYTASIGLLIYGLDKYTRPGSRAYRRENLIEKAVFRLKEILTDYF